MRLKVASGPFSLSLCPNEVFKWRKDMVSTYHSDLDGVGERPARHEDHFEEVDEGEPDEGEADAHVRPEPR